MDETNNIYYLLNYTHNELATLLARLSKNELLTPDQYDKLINQIGLDNISTFDLDFYKLKNRPVEVVRTSQLINDTGFADLNHLKDLEESKIEPLSEIINVLNADVEHLKNLDIADTVEEIIRINRRIEEIGEEILTLEEYTIDYRINLENIYDTIAQLDSKDTSLINNIALNKNNIDLLSDSLLHKQEEILAILDIVNQSTQDIADLEAIVDSIDKTHKSMSHIIELLADKKSYNDDGTVNYEYVGYITRIDELEQLIHSLDLSQYATDDSIVEYYGKVEDAINKYEDIVHDFEENNTLVQYLKDMYEEYLDSFNLMTDLTASIEERYNQTIERFEVIQESLDKFLKIDAEFRLQELSYTLSEMNISIGKLESDYEDLKAIDYVLSEEFEITINALDEKVRLLNDIVDGLTNIDHENFVTKQELNEISERLNKTIEDLNDITGTVNAIDLSLYVTKVNLNKTIEDMNLSQYATKEHLNNEIKYNLESYIPKDYLDEKIEEMIENTNDVLSTYATKDHLEKRLGTVVDDIGRDVNDILDDYTTIEYVEDYVETNKTKPVFITKVEYDILPEEEQEAENVLYVISETKQSKVNLYDYVSKADVDTYIRNYMQTHINKIIALEQKINTPFVFGNIVVSKTQFEVSENGTVAFSIKLDKAPVMNQVVNLSVNNGFVLLSKYSLTFTAENYDQEQVITATGSRINSRYEDEESIILLSSINVPNKTVNVIVKNVDMEIEGTDFGDIVVDTASIDLSEEEVHTFSVKLDKPPTIDQVVSISVNNNNVNVSRHNLVFDSLNWDRDQQVTIVGVHGLTDYEDKTSVITLASNNVSSKKINVSVANIDSYYGKIFVSTSSVSVNENATASFTVRLDSPPSTDQVIDLSLSNPDYATLDRTSLVFTSTNYNVEQTVTITGLHNTASNDNNSVAITLSNPNIESKVVTVTVNNIDVDNQVYGNIILSENAISVDEGNTATFTVALDQAPTSNQVVNLSLEKTDCAALNKSNLTFTPENYNIAQTVIITGLREHSRKTNNSTTVIVSSANVDTKTIAVIVNNIDKNSEHTCIWVNKNSLTITEGSSDTFTVELDFEPPSNQTITLKIEDDNCIVLDKTKLTFTTSNYDIPQTVRVSGIHDSTRLSNNSTTITLSGPDVGVETIFVTVKDIDSGTGGNQGESIETDIYEPPTITDGYYVGSGKQYATINEALNAIGSKGGQVVLSGGTYKETVTFKNSGTTSKPIIVMPAPGETVKIDGGNSGKSITMFDLNGKSNIHLYGLEICNANSGSGEAYAIYGGGGEKGIVIANCTIHDIKTTGRGDGDGEANAILLYGETTTPISDVLIYDNLIYNMETNWSESISVAGNCENVRIINNTLHNLSNIAMDFYGCAGYCGTKSLDQPRNCVMRGNLVYNVSCDYASAAAYYCDGARDCVIEKNIAYNCAVGIEVGSEENNGNTVGNITVRNNLIYNCKGYEPCTFKIGGYQSSSQTVTNVKVYNNTFATNAGAPMFAWGKAKNVEFINNIFYVGSSGGNMLDYADFPLQSTTFKNNLYYYKGKSDLEMSLDDNTYYSWNQWKSNYESTGILTTTSPFTNASDNNYTLSSSSPALNAGYNSVDVGSYDLAGNKRKNGNNIDIGCYER